LPPPIGMLDHITVHGARQHNLKNIDVEIPRNTFTVITGLSGSGKSSLAFDTIYAEGSAATSRPFPPTPASSWTRWNGPRWIPSMGSARPSRSSRRPPTGARAPPSAPSPRIYDYLRLLYSSIGTPHCPECGREISKQTTEQIVQQILALKQDERVMILAPIVRGRKGEYRKDLEKLGRQGFLRARVDGVLRPLDEPVPLDRRRNHTIEVLVDRLLVKPGIAKRLESPSPPPPGWRTGWWWWP